MACEPYNGNSLDPGKQHVCQPLVNEMGDLTFVRSHGKSEADPGLEFRSPNTVLFPVYESGQGSKVLSNLGSNVALPLLWSWKAVAPLPSFALWFPCKEFSAQSLTRSGRGHGIASGAPFIWQTSWIYRIRQPHYIKLQLALQADGKHSPGTAPEGATAPKEDTDQGPNGAWRVVVNSLTPGVCKHGAKVGRRN